MRSSMQKDVSAGRDPELDAIGGAIIRAGRKYAIGVPAIRKLVVEIQERLRRQRRPRQSAVSG
jgi:2-dehydropantoate 2-reductase